MRNNKELLEVFLYNVDLFDSGLCSWIYELWRTNIISCQERSFLMEIIKDNEPFLNRYFTGRAYYWKIGNINPRIKFLTKHLKY